MASRAYNPRSEQAAKFCPHCGRSVQPGELCPCRMGDLRLKNPSHSHLSDAEYSDMMHEYYKSIPDSPRNLVKRYGPNWRNRPDAGEILASDRKVTSTRSKMQREYKAMVEESNRRFHARGGTVENPLFLPKSLFDSYTIKSTDGSITVDRIQTIAGAERKVHELAKRYPCVGFAIKSAKHGGVIKAYAASVGKAAPKVTTDNTREYKRKASEEAKASLEYDIYIGGRYFSGGYTKAEARHELARLLREPENKDKTGRIEPMKGRRNPGYPSSLQGHGDMQVSNPRITGTKIIDMGDGLGLMTERSGFSGDLLYYPVERGISHPDGKPFWHKIHASAWGTPEYDFRNRASVVRFIKERKAQSKRNPREQVGAKSKTATGSASGKGASVGKTRTQAGSASGKGASVGKTRTSTQASTKGNRTVTLTSSPGARVSFGKNPEGDHEFIDYRGYVLHRRYDSWLPMQKTGPGGLKFLNGPSTRTVSGTKADAERLIDELLAGKYPWAVEKPRRGQRNPEDSDTQSAADLYEQFHGAPSTGEVIYEETCEVPDTFAELGDLVEIKVATIHGKDAVIAAPDPDGGNLSDIVKLVSSPDGRQLYFLGGDQSLDLEKLGFSESEERHRMLIGVLYELTYATKKKFHKFKLTHYYHELGEDTKNQPVLVFNPYTERMGIVGGDYHVKDVGIVN